MTNSVSNNSFFERYAFEGKNYNTLTRVSAYFHLGKMAAIVEADKGNLRTLVVKKYLQEMPQSQLLNIAKVISYCTVIIPLVMLIIYSIARSYYTIHPQAAETPAPAPASSHAAQQPSFYGSAGSSSGSCTSASSNQRNPVPSNEERQKRFCDDGDPCIDDHNTWCSKKFESLKWKGETKATIDDLSPNPFNLFLQSSNKNNQEKKLYQTFYDLMLEKMKSVVTSQQSRFFYVEDLPSRYSQGNTIFKERNLSTEDFQTFVNKFLKEMQENDIIYCYKYYSNFGNSDSNAVLIVF